MTARRVAILVALAALMGARPFAQSARTSDDTAPRFEVASVKPNTGPPGPPLIDGRAFRRSGRATVTNMSLLAMIQVLFRNADPAMLIEGGPDWLRSDRFDIVAQGDPGSDASVPSGQWLPRMNEMFKALLAERFNLRTHIEHRPMQIYALVAADAAHPAAKLHASKTPDCAAAQNDPERRCGLRRLGLGGITAVGITLDQFALTLSGSGAFIGLDRPVENRSGIEGRFDLDVMGDLEGARTVVDQNGRTVTLMPTGPEAGARLITMLKDQLGLALKSVPGARNVLVIDHADHPTPN